MIRKMVGVVAVAVVVVALVRLAGWLMTAPTLEALGVAFALAVATCFVRV